MATADKLQTEADARAIHLARDEGVTVKPPVGSALTFKVRGDETAGGLMAFESVTAPGEGPPLHVHSYQDEVWYALDGTFRFYDGHEVRDAPTGTFVFIPRGVAHTWQNVGGAPGRLLVLSTPAGLETFFERFAELPEGAFSPEEAFRTLGSEVGMDLVGPPLAESHPLPQ